ncbi:Striated muscle-specific serine/threonine-protein kinase [Varanus komodoensis]|nr:Striated muscle-specific serine/threonine-protein kinase [Varanus komodoensis]
MQKPPGQSSLGRATGDPAGAGRGSGRAPPSPTIPPKRAKVTAEEGGPAAPVFLQELKDTAAALGCDLVLRVVVAGRPQPHLTWYKEKAPFAPPREGGAEEEYGSLRIRNSKAADAGLYSCVAKNEHGEAASSATVTITGLEGMDKAGLAGRSAALGKLRPSRRHE